MEPWIVALIVLAAVLVGATLPLLFQIRATLKSVQTLLDDTRPRLVKTLGDVQGATHDLKVMTHDITQLVESVQSTLSKVAQIGAAVGPALVAGISAYKATRHRATKTEAEDEDEDEDIPHDGHVRSAGARVKEKYHD